MKWKAKTDPDKPVITIIANTDDKEIIERIELAAATHGITLVRVP